MHYAYEQIAVDTQISKPKIAILKDNISLSMHIQKILKIRYYRDIGDLRTHTCHVPSELKAPNKFKNS